MQDRNALVTRTKPTRSERASGALYHQIKAIKSDITMYSTASRITSLDARRKETLSSHTLSVIPGSETSRVVVVTRTALYASHRLYSRAPT